jgi:2-amino-4-hydroxy-6-hydroxymethyldihydropteridine diphosphokinase
MRAATGHDAATGGVLRPSRSAPGFMSAWIGLGGNFAESEALMREALLLLDAHEKVTVLRQSGVYRSPPWGAVDQPDFFNAVAELETSLPAGELLNELLDIENRLGRDRRGLRWGPRSIDLDLLTYQDLIVQSERLELPHPRMHLRAFVLAPILELEPCFEIPGIGTAQQALDRLDRHEVDAVQWVNL